MQLLPQFNVLQILVEPSTHIQHLTALQLFPTPEPQAVGLLLPEQHPLLLPSQVHRVEKMAELEAEYPEHFPFHQEPHTQFMSVDKAEAAVVLQVSTAVVQLVLVTR
jgi:hypothetical protein